MTKRMPVSQKIICDYSRLSTTTTTFYQSHLIIISIPILYQNGTSGSSRGWQDRGRGSISGGFDGNYRRTDTVRCCSRSSPGTGPGSRTHRASFAYQHG